MPRKHLFVPKLHEKNVRRLYHYAHCLHMPVSKLLNLIVATGLERLEEVNPTTTSALDMLIFLAYVASKHSDHPPPQEAKDVTGKSHARRGVRPPTV
jgi:hypothetical protein